MARLLSLLCLLGALLLAFAMPAMAQDQTATDEARKRELAQEMHEIRPSDQQVNAAIERLAQTYPPEQREAFKLAMSRALNYKAVEHISIEAMMETYTLPELEAMVAYFRQPEARSASDKYEDYAAKVRPELIKLIDKALMRVRAGEN